MKALLSGSALIEEMGELPPGTDVLRVGPDGPEPEGLGEVEFFVVSWDLVGRVPELLPRMAALRVVQSLSAGIEWLRPVVPEGVTLCNASGVHDVAVSEWVVAAILAMERRLPQFWDLQPQGRWDIDVNPATETQESTGRAIEDLEGREILILGHGSIGRAVEERLRPFGARVAGIARRPRPGVETMDRLEELLPRADVVVLLLPITEETKGLVDRRFLAMMKEGALLVNAARGQLVQTDALLDALLEGRVRAALDVTDPEPLPPDHPLWRARGVMITPHVAGSTRGWLARAYRFAGDQLRRYARGEPLPNVRTEY